MQEHSIAAAAHEKRDRFVHSLILNAVGVARPQNEFLPALVEAGERFAAAKNLLAGRERERGVDAARIIRRAAHEGKRENRRERSAVVQLVVRPGEQPPLGVADFNVPRIFQNRHRAKFARVTMAAADFPVFPRIVFRHFAGEHQFPDVFMGLRPARDANADCFWRDKLNGKWQRRICGVFIFRKFIWPDRVDDGEHIVERLPRRILRALIKDFSAAGGRIETGEFVREKIGVREIAEVAADVHRLVEQRQARVGGQGGNRRAQRDDSGGCFLECSHNLKYMRISPGATSNKCPQ